MSRPQDIGIEGSKGDLTQVYGMPLKQAFEEATLAFSESIWTKLLRELENARPIQ